MSGLQFQQAPPQIVSGKRTDPRIDETFEELKSNPGKWAMVEPSVSQRQGGMYRALANRGARCATRVNPDGTYNIWAAYIEDDDES